jgi:predicted metallo-beta-lactamase superfamily hydrolase
MLKMPRGRKKYTLEEKLENCIREISEKEKLLKELKVEKKELEDKVKSQRLAELSDLMEENGVSIDTVKSMIGVEAE